MPVEIESYGAVQIGAVDVDSSGLQAGEDIGLGQAKRGVEADRDYGEGWLHRLENLWSGGRGAAVMADLQEIRVRMVQGCDPSLDGFFGVTLEQD